MTWQKVVSAKPDKEAEFKVEEGAQTPEELGIEPEPSPHAAEIRIKGLFLELESKSGNTYEFGAIDRQPADQVEMAEDIIDALADDEEVWVQVDFDGGFVHYWATSPPWAGDESDIRDDYGLRYLAHKDRQI